MNIATMFDSIAPTYDKLNHILSFGMDKQWRKKAIETLKPSRPKVILDLATGTGDLAIEALRLNPKKIIGVDSSSKMLKIAQDKIKNNTRIILKNESVEMLSLKDNSVDAVTVAFGVRNFTNIDRCLDEVHRVLTSGNLFVVLELSKPTNPFLRGLYDFYSKKYMPWMGGKISRQQEAYSYLQTSSYAFVHGKQFTKTVCAKGFRVVSYEKFTFGICHLYVFEKR